MKYSITEFLLEKSLLTLKILIIGFLVSACSKGPDNDDDSGINRAPSSVAGVDQTLTLGDTINLDGSGSSDLDGDTLTYEWSITEQPQGAVATFSDITGETTTLSVDMSGSYTIVLTVSDSELSDSDSLTLTIEEIVIPNTSPTSNAGSDLQISLGESITLDGSSSSDSDGDELTYLWAASSIPDGASVTFSDSTSVNTLVTVDLVGEYELSLTVSDGVATSVDYVLLTVNAVDIPNNAPVSNAGTDQAVDFGDTITLDGSASSDPDGDTITFNWSLSSIPSGALATFSDATLSTPDLNVDSAGVYVANLTVSDGELTSSSEVRVQVNAANNDAPIINTFAATPNTGDSQTQVMFNWDISDANGDSLNCELDVDNDGSAEYTFTDCLTAISQNHTYDVGDNYTAKLTVSDGVGGEASEVTGININNPPVISVFNVSSNPALLNSEVTFSWDVSDIDGDDLVCYLDVDGDLTNDITIDACDTTTTQTYTYTQVGDYSPILTVEDGDADPVLQSLTLSVVDSYLLMNVTSKGYAVAGKQILYIITVGNTSAIPIDNVVVSLVVPDGLSFHDSAHVEPNSSNCLNDNCSVTSTSNVSWSLGTMLAGESQTITINGNLDNTMLDGETVTLVTSISGTDIDIAHVEKTITINNEPSAELALSASTDVVIAGESFSYVVDLGNIDSSSLDETELRVELPAGVTVSSISDGGVEESAGVVVWTEGSVAVSESIRRSVEVVVGDDLAPGFTLVASVALSHDDGLEVDNSAEHAVSVTEDALPIQVDIGTSADPVVSDGRVLYTITVGNTSALPVENV
ncbi:PKD domain-containing protein, partial [Paraglaciecola sp. 2405UD69-4]|uniref:PKD domain-containing protein n=1 Tax=Paraglaciecola sp. 2405UD69-4 TaxID=3391836 RepID=UPI0039C9B011